MRFGAPGFLWLALAAAIPIALHLFRRTPPKEALFSSLMFVQRAKPRLQKRTRIEDRLLLALRVWVVVLAAVALAQPSLGGTAMATRQNNGRRVLVLLDDSASMQRGNLWQQAQDHVLAEAATDRLAVYRFNQRTTPLIDFAEWTKWPLAERSKRLRQRLQSRQPGWFATDLDQALMRVGEALADDDAELLSQERPLPRSTEIVLLSDLQASTRHTGAAADLLPHVGLRVIALTDEGRNAAISVLPQALDHAPDSEVRVRVSCTRTKNCPDLELTEINGAIETVTLSLAAGDSKVLSLSPRSNNDTTALQFELKGDDHAFDNRATAPRKKARTIRIVYLGQDADGDSDGPLYYLLRAFPKTPILNPVLRTYAPGDAEAAAGIRDAHLLVIASKVAKDVVVAAQDLLHRGRTVLVVADGHGAVDAATALSGLSLDVEPIETQTALALTDLDFRHPLLVPFAGPRYSEFGHIRAWQPRRLRGADRSGAHVLARFENGDATWLSLPVADGAGSGTLLLMTTGWHPADSQLALSSKFVPLMHTMVAISAGVESGQTLFVVGQRVSLPASAIGRHVTQPDGTVVDVTAHDGSASFALTYKPGLYRVDTQPPTHFAVALAPSESQLTPMTEGQRLALGLVERPPEDAPQIAHPDQPTVTTTQNDLWWYVLATVMVLLLAESVVLRRRMPGAPSTQEAV